MITADRKRTALNTTTQPVTAIDNREPLLQNAEIFTLTYGSIVKQLIADLEDLEEVNKQLDQM